MFSDVHSASAPSAGLRLLAFVLVVLAAMSGCKREEITTERSEKPSLVQPALAMDSTGLVLLDDAPYTGVFEIFYPEKPDQVRFRIPFENGRIHGALLQFSRGGSVEREYHFLDGQWRTILGRYSAANKPAAPWGPIKFATQLQGEESPTFDPTLTAQEWFDRIEAVCLGALTGPHLRWYENGSLEAHNIYNGEGGFDGLGTEYDPEGTIKVRLLWENGVLREVLEETEEHKALRMEAGLLTVAEKAAADGSESGDSPAAQ